MFALWKRQPRTTRKMSRSERYREYERSSYSRRVYRECRDCGHSRRRRNSCDCWDSDGPEPWAPPRDPRPGHGHVQIALPEPPAPPPPPPPLPCNCQCCRPQTTAPPCHCTGCCAKNGMPNCCCPVAPQSNCRCIGCPRPALPPPAHFTIPVVDCSTGRNRTRNGETYTVRIAPEAIADDIISLLAPDRRRKKVIVRWKDGYSEKLDELITMDELRRKGKHLVVEDRDRERRCAH
ncbi:hypothetical protein TARUN_178 [Trichoderma arundinaceum]|uniref:Uncharacterized protein n=1 Tax=Trichoderma arundinaceum TaxID=490622 RepID=A0A395P0X1_TRIAR|nr:hypothetical protein TARUN_178 [Trichoderma arundinaceum]